MKNYYELLEIHSNAQTDDIRHAAQHKARIIDAQFQALSNVEKQVMIAEIQAQADEIKQALHILSDPEKRKAYDAELNLHLNPVQDKPIEKKSSIFSILFLIVGVILLYMIFFADEYLSAFIALFL